MKEKGEIENEKEIDIGNLIEIGKEMIGKEMIGKEMIEKEMIEKETIGKEMIEKELIEKEIGVIEKVIEEIGIELKKGKEKEKGIEIMKEKEIGKEDILIMIEIMDIEKEKEINIIEL